MNLKDSKKNARIKFWVGLLGSIIFGFTTIMTFLKNMYNAFLNMGDIGMGMGSLIEKIINFIYNNTYFITIFWELIWEKLPIFNIHNILQESNFYFLALITATLIFIIQIQEPSWINTRIRIAKRKIADELLERDIKKHSGLIDVRKDDILELEINIDNPTSWYQRPFGQVVIGLVITIVGGIVLSIIGISNS